MPGDAKLMVRTSPLTLIDSHDFIFSFDYEDQGYQPAPLVKVCQLNLWTVVWLLQNKLLVLT